MTGTALLQCDDSQYSTNHDFISPIERARETCGTTSDMGRDGGSVITSGLDDVPTATSSGKAPLSAKRLEALSRARDKALLSRRKKLKDRLEKKLAELRTVLGNDITGTPHSIERIAHAMMKQEDRAFMEIQRLREKQIASNEALTEELRAIRRKIVGSASEPSRSTSKPAKSHVARSDVSSIASRHSS